MVDEELPGHAGEGRLLGLGDPLAEKAVEIGLEVLEEQVAALAGEDADDVLLAVPQMVQDVGEDCLGGTAGEGKIMGTLHHQAAGNDVCKNVGAQLLEQIVLGLEVGVKGGAAHVGLVNDVLYGDLAVTLPGQELAERAEDRRPGFLLPSVQKKYLLYNLSVLFAIAQRKTIIR